MLPAKPHFSYKDIKKLKNVKKCHETVIESELECVY